MSTLIAALDLIASKYQNLFSVLFIGSILVFGTTRWNKVEYRVDQLSEEMKEVKLEIKDIKKDIVEMKSDIKVMKNDITEMKSDINEIKNILIKKNP